MGHTVLMCMRLLPPHLLPPPYPPFLPLPPRQECVVYLCGTKYDLVEENKKSRKIDLGIVRDYAEGKMLMYNESFPMFT